MTAQIPYSHETELNAVLERCNVVRLTSGHVNSSVAAGRANLCALARRHLADLYWTLRAVAQPCYKDMSWPNEYLMGETQLEWNLAWAAETVQGDRAEANG